MGLVLKNKENNTNINRDLEKQRYILMIIILLFINTK